MSDIRSVLQANDKLGEGPVWSPLDQRLYWFEIQSRRLNWYDPASKESGAFELPLRATAAAARASGGLLLATEKGIAAIDVESGELGMIEAFDLGQGFRSGDGQIDMEGRFWWSTMDEGGQRPGAVYRTGPDWKTRKVLGGIQRPDAISFSPDGRLLYIADGRLQTMFAHETRDVSEVREFAHLRGETGAPGGSAVDAEGYVWSAQRGASRIVRYAPDGRVDRILRAPVSQPTSCAFGGLDLKTLYITSAWEGLSADQRAREPLAGALFAFEADIAGCPLPLFEG